MNTQGDKIHELLINEPFKKSLLIRTGDQKYPGHEDQLFNAFEETEKKSFQNNASFKGAGRTLKINGTLGGVD